MEQKDLHALLLDAKAFTDAHAAGGDIALRELRCLRVQFPAVFLPMRETDLFTGYVLEPIVGYRYSWNSNIGLGFFCKHDELLAAAEDESLSAEDRALAAELEAYWKDTTTRAKWDRVNPNRDSFFYPNLAEVYPRLAEINLDFDKLLQLGIPGLRKEMEQLNRANPLPLYEAELGTLDLIADMLRYLAADARALIPNASGKRVQELVRLADTLEHLADHAPDSFYGALCLFHLIVMMTSVDNFARMDVYMGDFLVHDLDSGVLTYEEALDIFVNLYRRYDELFSTTGRIIIGGKGRRNVENADRMALFILDAAKIVHGAAPTLCLRLYPELNRAIWEKAMDTLEAGCSYPLLYNDAVNIPGRMRAMNIPEEAAEQYIMSNCGEYGIWAQSIHSPDAAVNYAKVLELALFNGVDPLTGKQDGPQTGDAANFTSADELLEAFKTQSTYFLRMVTDRLISIYEVAAEDSHNLVESLLYADCLENGKGLLSGARYKIYDVETHAAVLVADSLTAVRKVVFEDGVMTMAQLLEALKKNFEGFEAERQALLAAPKFGNNDPVADEMARYISDFIHEETAAQAARLGVQAVTASQITVDNYEVMGNFTGATPDGRLSLTPLTNSMNPTNGQDKSGITSLLTSMAGVDTSLSGGQVSHLKLSPSAFRKERRPVTEALFDAFFRQGGGELSVYTVDQQDLIDAVEHPEKHPNLIVRIGGYNARFITLTPALQREMIARNAYIG